MSRLIVISNRVNPPADTAVASVGGLAMALSAALRQENGLWFGWSGKVTPRFSNQIAIQRIGGVTVALINLEQQDLQEYYNGYANKTLWPLFHHRPDLVAFERSFDEGYSRVNQRFANTVFPLIEPDDIVWVHDYHMIPMGKRLREKGLKNRIGFFLHIPWPAPALLTTLPRHQELVESLFDYDLIGLQNEENANSLIEYILQVADGKMLPDGRISAYGKTTSIKAFPIGIDAREFMEASTSQKAREYYELMRYSSAGRKLIVGVDRLDYSKGLEERFVAYDQFLRNHPDYQGNVFFLQIATPSRGEVNAYQSIREKLDSMSGHINGEHATVDWVPLRYVNRSYRRDELAGIYRAAHVGLVTPLRDGMNLVAKEYIAAQDPEDPGVLILSEFAGAAAQMKDALIVNPFDRETVAEAIREALAMPLRERIARYEALMHGVVTDDVVAWRDNFVRELKSLDQNNKPSVVSIVP
ncbi:alpha,alpha-trehalose-phosphate synthase (UDP-forming) [Cellvibrio polysaccharolyticus]|uniref:Trehalose-6-phosphate synthase n=1 Tax=Cellvibrio polysaccharolyticus TaxID=2082724 RepID=A0A928YUR9_9GAMM|nr:alpha,alpha-trehalose-phosphate synthase (UDP-forming) [Cellvibrio polysaccharolyticus]MBE8717765.1 alpha,alpha-trehalose-phosphate synthase (UDP-forming) [Cellvibrio polysaccharolyticus]